MEGCCEKVGVELEQYWKKTDRTFTLEMMDMNGDETAERVYIIDNYMQAWMNNVNAPFSSTNGRELFVGIFPKGDVKIILFSEHSRTRVQVLVSAE